MMMVTEPVDVSLFASKLSERVSLRRDSAREVLGVRKISKGRCAGHDYASLSSLELIKGNGRRRPFSKDSEGKFEKREKRWAT